MAAVMKHMASNFAKLKKFKGVDFKRWQKKMHFLLSSMSMVYVLTALMPEDGGENPTVDQVRKRAKWDNDDYVCRGLILNGMSDSLFDVYQNVETSKELWDTLEAKYMAKYASSKKFLVSNFTNYKMTDSRPVLEQYNELLGILGRFTQHKMNMDESIQVSCIIDKLPPSWKDFKHTLKHLKEELTLIELGNHLRIEESLRAQDNNKPKGNNVAGPSVVNMCGKPGHLKKDCKAGNVGSRANRSSTKGSEDGSSNPLKGQNMFNKSHQIYYVTYVSEAFFVQDDDVAWWVDSGAIVHVCKDRCWFKTYESLNDGSILHMGNESTALVHGRGCVDLRFSSRKVVSLLNVLHVPNIRKNLVSSSILNNCGYKQVIESNNFVLSKHGVFIDFGYLSNHMFRLNIVFDNIGSAFMSTSKLNDSILWHARLGHVHFKRMQDMSKDGLIPSFDMDTEKCQTCMMNKITKKPFQNVKRETKVLELIHSDLCDLHATPSLGNKKYFVIFIDDASRFCYVNLLHSKDEALDKFKSVGIIHETTAPYTPQQNGISERKNRVLKEMDNSMLSYSGLSQGLWGEALLTACYLLNRVPNKRNRVTPYELWTKKKPNLNYLRVWGCRAVVRLPDPKLKTLGERGIKCIFVGYAEHSKAFRFYVIEPNDSVAINSIIESRDAIFDEHKKEAINDEMDSIMGNNTWVLTGLPPGCRPLGCKWIFKRKLKVDGTVENLIIHQMDVKTDFLNGELEEEVYMNQPLGFILPGNENKVDLTKKFLSSMFSMKNMGEADVILGIRIKHEKVLKKFNYSYCTLVSTPLDTCEKLMLNRDLTNALMRVKLEGNTESWNSTLPSKLQRVLNTEENQESKFMALATTGKEADWLKNLLLEIPLWVKPMSPISTCCNSVATLAKVYSQMYNRKSRHLGVRHSMIRELITNRVVSIEFVRSQQNLADHLTKGLARDLVIKSAEEMGLKSN
ncbi:zinc finger, CCHC-type containing protein [Tanacetum coccineum]